MMPSLGSFFFLFGCVKIKMNFSLNKLEGLLLNIYSSISLEFKLKKLKMAFFKKMQVSFCGSSLNNSALFSKGIPSIMGHIESQ